MSDEGKVENSDVHRCIECELAMPFLKEPMDENKAVSGFYNDMNFHLNVDGDACKCTLDNPPTLWCDYCSACFTCSQ